MALELVNDTHLRTLALINMTVVGNRRRNNDRDGRKEATSVE